MLGRVVQNGTVRAQHGIWDIILMGVVGESGESATEYENFFQINVLLVFVSKKIPCGGRRLDYGGGGGRIALMHLPACRKRRLNL